MFSFFRSVMFVSALLFSFLSQASSFDLYSGRYEIIKIDVPLPSIASALGDTVIIGAAFDETRIEILKASDYSLMFTMFTMFMRAYSEDLGEGRAASADFEERNGGPYWSEGSNGGGSSKTSVNLVPQKDGTYLLKIDSSSSYNQDQECEIYLRKVEGL